MAKADYYETGSSQYAASSSLSSSSNLFYGLHSRRLLLHTPLYPSSDNAAPPSTSDSLISPESRIGDNSFDANIVMILSVLLCALICAFGLNSVVRCALRCSRRSTLDSSDSLSTRLANTGVKREVLKMFPTVTYSADLKLPALIAECTICLSEFTVGERLRVLPKCNHGFHLRCIDKWLTSHSSCPTCRHCLIDTCQKIVGCTQASSSNTSPPSQSRMVALEPEELIRSNRFVPNKTYRDETLVET